MGSPSFHAQHDLQAVNPHLCIWDDLAPLACAEQRWRGLLGMLLCLLDNGVCPSPSPSSSMLLLTSPLSAAAAGCFRFLPAASPDALPSALPCTIPARPSPMRVAEQPHVRMAAAAICTRAKVQCNARSKLKISTFFCHLQASILPLP